MGTTRATRSPTRGGVDARWFAGGVAGRGRPRDRVAASLATELAGYLAADVRQPILAVTTSERRALGLAQVAADIGADVLATTSAHIRTLDNPQVFDALRARRVSLAETSAHRAAQMRRP